MKGKSLKGRLRPHLWYQAYWFVYLIWFSPWMLWCRDPKYIIHSPLDDYIPFNEWFVFPYCSWFVLLALVLALLWWNDTPSYDRLCLSMFSGMSLCLILYMLFPNGLQLRPDPATLGRTTSALADAAALDGGLLQQCLPLHPLSKHRLHGTGHVVQLTGIPSPLDPSGCSGMGRFDLCFHPIYQAACGGGCGHGAGYGSDLAAGIPPEMEKLEQNHKNLV